MPSNALLKDEFELTDEFEEHMAPSPPPVAVFWYYRIPIKRSDIHWQSEPNNLTAMVLKHLRSDWAKNGVDIGTMVAYQAALIQARGLLTQAAEDIVAKDKLLREKTLDLQQSKTAMQQHIGFDAVSRTAVIRGGALIVGAMSVACWIGTALSGTIFIHPLISTLLVIASLAFYGMSKLEK